MEKQTSSLIVVNLRWLQAVVAIANGICISYLSTIDNDLLTTTSSDTEVDNR